MKSNFVSSVSFTNWRAPLAAVRLMAESLDGGRIVEEDKRRDYYRLIVQECPPPVRTGGECPRSLAHRRRAQELPLRAGRPGGAAAAERRHHGTVRGAERQVTLRLAPDAAARFAALLGCCRRVEQSLVNLLGQCYQAFARRLDRGNRSGAGGQAKSACGVEDSGAGDSGPLSSDASLSCSIGNGTETAPGDKRCRHWIDHRAQRGGSAWRTA